jgi:hypothetical protein
MSPTNEKVKTGNADFQRIGIDRLSWKNEVDQDTGHRTLALKNYQEMLDKQPFDIVLLSGYKFIRFWYATDSGRNQLAIISIHLPIVLLALIGIFHQAKQGAPFPMLAILLLIGYTAALHTIMFPLVRYAIPIMPYILIFTTIGFERMRSAFK